MAECEKSFVPLYAFRPGCLWMFKLVNSNFLLLRIWRSIKLGQNA